MTSRTLLIVDDDEDLRATLVEQLGLYEEFDVLQEATAAKGIAAARAGSSTSWSWMSACRTWMAARR